MGEKAFKLPEIPRMSIVQLEVAAVTRYEEWNQTKVDLKSAKRIFIEHLCVDFLRHSWQQEYTKILERKNLTDEEYLELNRQFANAVEKTYPELGDVAQMQFFQKRRKIRSRPANPLDCKLDDIIHEVGFQRKIRFWKWTGLPGPFYSQRMIPLALDVRVVKEINQAPEGVCASSESEYVRGCKEWLSSAGSDLKPLFKELGS